MPNKYLLNKDYIFRKIIDDYILINKKGAKEFLVFDGNKSKYIIKKLLEIDNSSINDSTSRLTKEQREIELLKKELLRNKIIKRKS